MLSRWSTVLHQGQQRNNTEERDQCNHSNKTKKRKLGDFLCKRESRRGRRTDCRVSMASLMSSACLLFMPVALLLMLSPCPVAAASARRCHSIYKGFAQCLMALGDSLTDSARKDEDVHEIHSICRSWDEFHDCANVAMAGCPEEAAAVWESLRQESKKMQFSGNLYDMCSNRNSHPVASISPHGSPNQEELSQESLRGCGDHQSGCLHFLLLLPHLLLWLFWI